MTVPLRLFDEWLLLPQRIALHEPSATAVLADVHLGYSAVRQQLGDAVPAHSVEEELLPLVQAVQAYPIRRLFVAGDLFERGYDGNSYQTFLDVATRLDLCWLGLAPGNHDRGVERAGERLPRFADGYALDGWCIQHGDRSNPSDPSGVTDRVVMGHWHPAVRWLGRKRACFLVCGRRIILPAFSLDAAGVDVGLNPRWQDWQRYVLFDQQIVPMSCSLAPPGKNARTRGKRRGS